MSSSNRRAIGIRNNRNRSRDPEEDLPSGFGASSPAGDIRSSPPAYPMQHGGDDDDDIIEDDAELALDIDDADEMAEDEDGIDLFGNNFERDYRAREDDQYSERDLDDEGEYEGLDLAARRNLESRLNKRDRELARQRRM